MTIISPLARLDFRVRNAELAPFVQVFAEALHACGLPPAGALASPIGTRSTVATVDQWRASQARAPEASVMFRLGPLHTGTVAAEGEELQARLACSVEDDRSKLPQILKACAQALVQMAAGFEISDVTLSRDGEPGFKCLPLPPAVGRSSHAVLLTPARIAESYESEAAFLAAWPDHHQISGRWLLFRGLEHAANTDFLRVLIASQWSLARSAKPRLTRFRDPAVESHEEAAYHAGSPTVRPVAHVAQSKIAEMTCVPPAGEFIRGWEVFNLRHIIVTGALDDGRPVETLRVMFLDRTSAEANKRVLLDIGAKVAYPDQRGEPSYVED